MLIFGESRLLVHELVVRDVSWYCKRFNAPTHLLQHHPRIRQMSMNRPRNRQPKPPRGGRGGDRGGSARVGHSSHPRSDYKPVPNVQQVIPGASVSIVLKQDQPTGREVQGTVQELLTRGDHPRGIKVRLADGRVGRVQRMVQSDGTFVSNNASPSAAASPRQRYGQSNAESREEGPPPRTLADYIPSFRDEEEPRPGLSDVPLFASATAKCPICGLFEGDEIAVSRHVDEHLT